MQKMFAGSLKSRCQTYNSYQCCPVILPWESKFVLLGATILGAVVARKYSTLQEAMKALNVVGQVIYPSTDPKVKLYTSKTTPTPKSKEPMYFSRKTPTLSFPLLFSSLFPTHFLSQSLDIVLNNAGKTLTPRKLKSLCASRKRRHCCREGAVAAPRNRRHNTDDYMI